eukprot:TRINITY_DN4076_c2_g1_i1.p1 TRINITY_DN4076_c2_g1~~TRINITY_DN4076_c2_g1_i1.p1  ORF type:complete len:947 (+),score=163.95 TRINITY_DN4076_c2_g1_i1:92-2932(+)
METLKLGELYERACKALARTPEKEFVEALNSDDPKLALIKLISSNQALDITNGKAAPFAENNVVDHQGLDAKLPHVSDVEHCVQNTATEQNAGKPCMVEDSLTMQQELEVLLHRAEASPPRAQVWQLIQAIGQMSLRGDSAQTYIQKAREQLDQSLEKRGQEAAKRQADRRAERATLGNELDPAVKRKLTKPEMPLSPEDSRSCLMSCIECGKIPAAHADRKNVVVVLGNTGAGKSAFINLLHGCTFELNSDDNMVVRSDSALKELVKIGHTNRSETFAPQVEEAVDSFGEGYAFVDCPGFLDNRGFEINVANAVNVRQTVAAAASLHVIVIINYHTLLADRGKGVKDLFHILSDLFGTIDNVKKNAGSVLLAISKAPPSHPETGHAMTSDRYKEKLLDPSGLDEVAQELICAIGDANVIIYHLLERGDSSWLKRDAIIARIKAMVPMTQPGSLFQSAINDADKECLRNLVSELGKRIKSAVGAADYDVAADMASDLLELKLVEHDFVTSIVDEVVSDVCESRMAIVRSIVEEQKDRDNEDIDTPMDALIADVPKLDHARQDLRSMSLVLAAFAGIADVREKLKELLIDATCQFESAVKKVAEDVGRQEVEESFRMVLRTVGDNVVREVLELPKARATMKSKHCEESRQLERLQADQLSQLHESASKEQVDAAVERHAIQLRELSWRVNAANHFWQEHVDNAATKMEQRDRDLLGDESSAFWAKLGWSDDQFCKNAEAGPVNLSGKKISNSDCEIMAAVFRKFEGPPSLKALFLSTNLIGDVGLMTLSDATFFGALPNLERVFLNNNKIGDVGLAELSSAMAAGHLRKLIFLDLNSNQIGNLGITSLANAIVSSAMSDLQTLYLHCNMISDAGVIAFTNSLSKESLGKLQKLWLYNNRIGNVGMKALSDLIDSGRLVSLKSLQIEGNLAHDSYEVQKSILQTLRGR